MVNYDSGRDTLFVKSTSGKTAYHFPKTYDCHFGGEHWFTARKNDTLIIQDLENGQRQIMPNIASDWFSSDGRYHLLFQKEPDGYRLVIKSAGRTIHTVTGIRDWKPNPQANALLYTTRTPGQSAVAILYLSRAMKTRTITTGGGSFSNPVWSQDAASIAWMEQRPDATRLVHYHLRKAKLSSIDPRTDQEIPSGFEVALQDLAVAPDNIRIIFRLAKSQKKAIDPDAVQVWHTFDKYLPRNIAALGEAERHNKFAVWTTSTGKITAVNKEENTHCIFNHTYSHAILFDATQYEPQEKEFADRDIYAVNLETGVSKKILERHSGEASHTLLSPTGKYLLYARDQKWWLYEFSTEKHTCISGEIPCGLFRKTTGYDDTNNFGTPAFTPGDSSVLINDEYDIWELPVDGKNQARLTNGREQKTRYRLKPILPQQGYDSNDNQSKCGTADFGRILLFEKVEWDGSNSLVELRKGKPETVWATGQYIFTHTMKAPNSDRLIAMTQNFETPPALVGISKKGVTGIHQSNLHYKKYAWGKETLLPYEVDNKPLAGILYYPAGFTKGKKYPMVIHIYERQSKYLHDYFNPSYHNRDGFNIANLTAQGYFVFMPDIIYTEGQTGQSALKSVMAATDAAIATGFIDESRMALLGHSFGGYETMYVVTQTNRFATAVAGSGISDFIRQYLSVDGLFLQQQYYRAESQQNRLGKSLFEDYETYRKNSPVYLAQGIATPLLLWTGANDTTVDPAQTIEMHMALRRLRKENTMLVYPNEDHAISTKKNEEDLTRRIEQWLAHHLKDGPAPSWVK